MSTPNRTYALRCIVPVAAIALSVTTAFAGGLLTVKSFSLAGNAVQPAVAFAAMGEPAAVAPASGTDLYVSP